MTSRSIVRFFAVFAALVLLTTPAFAQIQAEATVSADRLVVQPMVSHDGGQLTLAGPGGRHMTTEFTSGSAVIGLYDEQGALPDGTYVWELRTSPVMSSAQRDALAEVRDDARLVQLQESGAAPTGIVQYGVFTLKNGVPVDSTLIEGSDFAAEGVLIDPATGTLFEAAQVFATDLIVQGSTCIGIDCSTTESFGSDTLRLKENNLRIHFDDTSSSASFPNNDWRIIANDTSNGGDNYLAVQDATAGNVPFRIKAAAGANRLVVDDNGFIGIGTIDPPVLVTAVDGNTPTLRLQQDGSDGFATRTWDIAGNETNFFVRDVNSSSALPLRIFPGTGDDNAVLRNGRLGVGLDNPSDTVHVRKADGTTKIFIEEQSTTGGNIVMLRAENAGGNVQTEFAPADGAVGVWRQNFRNTSLDLNFTPAGGSSFTAFSLDTSGNATALSFTGTSDRNAKRGFSAVDGQDVLAKIAAMPVTTWVYKADATEALHIGPMAQDFHAAFGLGADELHINPQDTASVALVGVQALNDRLTEKDAEVEALRALNAELIERLEALEAKLAE
ncbi:MAG: tail fiber domain-containing protein [Acidobacteriota bacterium]